VSSGVSRRPAIPNSKYLPTSAVKRHFTEKRRVRAGIDKQFIEIGIAGISGAVLKIRRK
jgi:hypothetical protein